MRQLRRGVRDAARAVHGLLMVPASVEGRGMTPEQYRCPRCQCVGYQDNGDSQCCEMCCDRRDGKSGPCGRCPVGYYGEKEQRGGSHG